MRVAQDRDRRTSPSQGPSVCITAVIDHETGRIVRARKDRSSEVINEFLDTLGEDRSKLFTHVSAAGAQWIHGPFRVRPRGHRDLIWATFDYGLVNAASEATNAQQP